MKIYTKTGDKGETGLFGGDRVPKDSPRIRAYGTIDELNAFIGLTITEIKDNSVKSLLGDIQNKLFIIGSDLATPDNDKTKKLNIYRTPVQYYEKIEKHIDEYLLHVCRTIARRAERELVALNNTVKIGDNIIIFINRLSDLFFVLSRYENKVSGFEDIKWQS